MKVPRLFLGALPAPVASSKKYRIFSTASRNVAMILIRKPLERHLLNAQHIECLSTQDVDTLRDLQDRCSAFLSKHQRKDGGNLNAVRIAIQSLCAPQCGYFRKDMVSFLRSLKVMVRSSNAVAVITFPNTLLSDSFCKRWQHLADTLLSIKAIPDLFSSFQERFVRTPSLLQAMEEEN